MIQGWLADLVLLVHFAFVAFACLGGLLILLSPWWAAFHLPCALYGAGVELIGWTCPLTPLEQHLRARAGEAGYSGGFIDHYVGGWLYPDDWSEIRIWLGWLFVALNVLVYAIVLRRRRRHLRTG
jgi:hypothetical protein